MSERFHECLASIFREEGGYSNNKKDRGGATNAGITQVTYSNWLALKKLKDAPVKEATLTQTRAIYQELYWDKVHATSIPAPLDLVVFDSAVQHGPAKAASWLQFIVGAKMDSVIGQKTLSALALAIRVDCLKSVIEKYIAHRESFYARIIRNDPTQEVFRNGWRNRIKRLRQQVRELV